MAKSERFQKDLLDSLTEIVRKVNVETRSENELEAYINRLVEDLHFDLQRFSLAGISAIERGRLGATEREVRLREASIKNGIVSMLTKAEIDQLDERKFIELKARIDNLITKLMGRFGVPWTGGFAGETDDTAFSPQFPKDWFIQHILVRLSEFKIGDLTNRDKDILFGEVQKILKEFHK